MCLIENRVSEKWGCWRAGLGQRDNCVHLINFGVDCLLHIMYSRQQHQHPDLLVSVYSHFQDKPWSKGQFDMSLNTF